MPTKTVCFLKQSGIEQTALSLFLSFEGNRAESFYENAEYYRSSVASALFWSLRRQQGENISVCESNMQLEHRRWNAYTRTEGYRYGKVRSDTEKTHPSLVAWNMLSGKTQQLDANPIRAAWGEQKTHPHQMNNTWRKAGSIFFAPFFKIFIKGSSQKRSAML